MRCASTTPSLSPRGDCAPTDAFGARWRQSVRRTPKVASADRLSMEAVGAVRRVPRVLPRIDIRRRQVDQSQRRDKLREVVGCPLVSSLHCHDVGIDPDNGQLPDGGCVLSDAPRMGTFDSLAWTLSGDRTKGISTVSHRRRSPQSRLGNRRRTKSERSLETRALQADERLPAMCRR